MNQISNKKYENKVDFKPFSNSQYSNYSKDKTKYMDSAMAATEDAPDATDAPAAPAATATAATAAPVAQSGGGDIIKEDFVSMGKVSRKNLVEKFIFDNKGLSEEFYNVMKMN